MLYRWNNKRFDREYQGRIERTWKQWKKEKTREQRTLETIQEKDEEEEEENEQEFEGDRIEEQDKDDIGNLQDPYDKL